MLIYASELGRQIPKGCFTAAAGQQFAQELIRYNILTLCASFSPKDLNRKQGLNVSCVEPTSLPSATTSTNLDIKLKTEQKTGRVKTGFDVRYFKVRTSLNSQWFASVFRSIFFNGRPGSVFSFKWLYWQDQMERKVSILIVKSVVELCSVHLIIAKNRFLKHC